MRIVVLVKHVPEPTASWRFADDLTLDRAAVPGRLSELDGYAVEQAVRLVEGGLSAEIACLTMGPEKAADSLRKALSMGADQGVHVLDDAIHGSDAVSTSLVLAAAIRLLGFDLVICGMASTDAEMSVMPAMVASRLGIPQLTLARDLRVEGSTVDIRRDVDGVTEQITAELPALVSVTDQSGEPRYPSFRAIVASKKTPVRTWTLADLDIPTERVGLAAARTTVRAASPRPAREAGTIITDDGTGAALLADFLTENKLI